MKLTCPQATLNKAVAIANRAVSQRSTLPIMTHLLLAANGDELRISGTSVNMRIDCTVSCTVDYGGDIAIPARLFTEIASKLQGNITLEVNDRTKTLDIRCGNYKSKINGLDAFDFPARPDDSPLAIATINAPSLCQLIDHVAFAASTDLSRQTLSGVMVAIDHDRMLMAATNSYRLAVRSNQLADPISESQLIIVPAASLHEVSAVLAGDEPAIVKIYDNRIAIHAASLDISVQTVAGNFPDYNAIIPKTYATVATVDAKAFARALQVARILTKQDKDGVERVDLTVGANQLALSVANAEVGDSGDAIEATVTGKPTEITLNIAYLLDVLKLVEGNVELHLNGVRMPCIVRLPNVPESEFIQAIMPFWRNE